MDVTATCRPASCPPKRDEYVTEEAVLEDPSFSLSHTRSNLKTNQKFGTSKSESGVTNKTAWVTSRQYTLVLLRETK